MFKAMNENAMMAVDGGFYYVYTFYYKTTSSGIVYIGKSVKQVSSWSGATTIYILNGKRVMRPPV